MREVMFDINFISFDRILVIGFDLVRIRKLILDFSGFVEFYGGVIIFIW